MGPYHRWMVLSVIISHIRHIPYHIISQHITQHSPMLWQMICVTFCNIRQLKVALAPCAQVTPKNEIERLFNVVVIMSAMVIFSTFISAITNAMNQLRNLNSPSGCELRGWWWCQWLERVSSCCFFPSIFREGLQTWSPSCVLFICRFSRTGSSFEWGTTETTWKNPCFWSPPVPWGERNEQASLLRRYMQQNNAPWIHGWNQWLVDVGDVGDFMRHQFFNRRLSRLSHGQPWGLWDVGRENRSAACWIRLVLHANRGSWTWTHPKSIAQQFPTEEKYGYSGPAFWQGKLPMIQ